MKALRDVLISAIVFLAFMSFAWSQPASTGEKGKPKPAPPKLPPADFQNVKYGPYERNVFDLWKAKSEKPTPLLVNIHGGGFLHGDKSNLSPGLLRQCLESGISVASTNYRYSSQAPFPAPFLDAARAIQFMRAHAQEYNIDPKRVACTGGSAGAGISLWLGFHPDLADPKNDDPVLRQSTRLSCMIVNGAQCSYDPRFITKIIGPSAAAHPAILKLYGLTQEEADTPRAYKMYEEAAPINYVSRDSPPVLMFYNEKGPIPPDAKPGAGIHHVKFGEVLKAKLDPLGVECIVHLGDDYKGKPPSQQSADMMDFLKRHFGMQKPGAGEQKLP
jgi:acetyl esterase/lipase